MAPTIDRAQYGLAAVLALVGLYTIFDARGLNVGFGDPIGPRVFPYVIGTAMVILAVLLAIATARGDVPQAEGGEDVDVTTPPDWVTVGKLVAILVLNILFVNVLGWAITGGFCSPAVPGPWGVAPCVRDMMVGVVMAVASWYFFYVGLGVPLSPGILDGIL